MDVLSDEEIFNLRKKASKLDLHLSRLTPNTVAKSSQDFEDLPDASEANALNLVFRNDYSHPASSSSRYGGMGAFHHHGLY